MRGSGEVTEFATLSEVFDRVLNPVSPHLEVRFGPTDGPPTSGAPGEDDEDHQAQAS